MPRPTLKAWTYTKVWIYHPLQIGPINTPRYSRYPTCHNLPSHSLLGTIKSAPSHFWHQWNKGGRGWGVSPRGGEEYRRSGSRRYRNDGWNITKLEISSTQLYLHNNSKYPTYTVCNNTLIQKYICDCMHDTTKLLENLLSYLSYIILNSYT